MAKITGLGGIFWKGDTAEMSRWFTEVLDLPTERWGRVFPWRESDPPHAEGCTVLGLHGSDSTYFDPSPLPFMINLRVDDLEGMLAQLAARGVTVVRKFDPDPQQGKFAHVMGPGGLKIELWEPAPDGS